MVGSLSFVLADGQALFLDALRAVLSGRGHRVLATTTTRRALLEELDRVRPDVCVIDGILPDGDGIQVIPEIHVRSPITKVVVLTADDRETEIRRALEAGAGAFAHKSRGLSAVLTVLEDVGSVERDVLVALPVRSHLPAEPSSDQMMRHLASFLTPREVQCLTLLTGGFDTVHIATRLGVSLATVRSHVQSVLSKLGVRTRMEAAALAIQHGLVAETRSRSLAVHRSTTSFPPRRPPFELRSTHMSSGEHAHMTEQVVDAPTSAPFSDPSCATVSPGAT